MTDQNTLLDNKIALVTGGSRGLGKNMALNLARQGANVIITYRSRRDEAEQAANEIIELGRAASTLQLDVGQSNTFGNFSSRFSEALSDNLNADRFDILVNNAGIIAHEPVTETLEQSFDDLLNVHLKGPYFLTQTLLPLLNDGGRIINVSSGLARFAIPGYAAYAAMKSGIETYTRYLAKELGERKITANVVAPGAIHTDINKAALQADENLEAMLSSVTALGRMGVPEDIGGVVAFLASESARWISGQRIEASGGMFL